MEDLNQTLGTESNDVTPPATLPGDSPKWWIDEGVPGIGDRPQWLPEKFKNIKDAVTSGLELEKKLGTAPVNDYDFGEYGEHFDKEHEAFKELQAYAKEKRVPQEVVSKMLESFTKYGESIIGDTEAIAAAERAKLGPDADKQIEVLSNWVKANLSAEAAEGLFEGMSSAKSVKAMMEIRAKMIGTTNPNIPNGSEQQAAAAETVKDLADELASPANFEKYKTDDKYRNDWKRRNEAAVQRANGAGYVSKDGSGSY